HGGDCPNGSHCDGSTNVCVFECIASSDCGANKSCSADGRCALAIGGQAQAGTISTVNVLANGRCGSSGDCAARSYCDLATTTCRSDCSDAAPCATGLTCTTRGRCSDPNNPTPTLPRLDASQTTVELTPGAASAAGTGQKVTLTLSTDQAAVATAAAR